MQGGITTDLGAPAASLVPAQSRWNAGGLAEGLGGQPARNPLGQVHPHHHAHYQQHLRATVGPTVNAAPLKGKPVEVEALVLIKMIRHCRDYFPTPVNGLLLGLDQPASLEITDCFGLQNKQDLWNQLAREKLDAKEVDEKVLLEDHRYQVKMLELLNVVNADSCNVGWYQTLQFSDLKDPSIVEGLCDHQALVPDAVCIGFDPEVAALGAQAFRAFRVTEEVLRRRKGAECGEEDTTVYNGLRSKDVLVEVPLFVRNSLLVEGFLTEWLATSRDLQRAGEFSALEEGDRGNSMQKGLEFIVTCLDEIQLEQDKLMRHQKEVVRQYQKQKEFAERRRLENEQRRLKNEELLPDIPLTVKKTGAPSPIPTLLMSNHVARVSESISQSISENLCRTALLQKELSRV